MMPSGDRLSLALEPADGSALGVEWDEDVLRGLGAARQAAAGEAPRAWQLEREPDWERTSALRLISAVFDDGALLGVAALRPRGAAGHDADAVAALLVSAAGDLSRPHEAPLSPRDGPGRPPPRPGLGPFRGAPGPPIPVVADHAR